MQYIQSLDGLRGIAVLLVVVYHFRWTEGGYIGVDIFFALSGYLITSLLLSEYRMTGTIDMKSFYIRRALRLLPAFLALSLACTIIRQRYQLPHLFTPRGLLSSLFYIGNWMRALEVDDLGIFGHTWSLAIEEQFYLIWPVTLLFALRRFTLPQIRTGIVIAYCASVAACLLMAQSGKWERVYNGSDTRAQAVLIGCFQGIAVVQLPQWVGYLGLAGIAAIGILGHRHDTFLIAAMIAAPICAAGIISTMIGNATSAIQACLSFRPLVAVGKVSYGLYLWHLPIIVIFGEKLGRPMTILMTAGLTVTSYYLIERPFLRLKSRFETYAK